MIIDPNIREKNIIYINFLILNSFSRDDSGKITKNKYAKKIKY